LRRLPAARAEVVYDVDLGKAQQVAHPLGCQVAASLDDAVRRDEVDAVIVATPTELHQECVLAALEAGKPVLTEKPLARHLSQIDACFGLAQQRGLPLFVAFQRRFDPSFAELVRAVHAGEIGQLQFVRSVSRDNPVPSVEYLRNSGGIYHDCVVHDLDMICHIAREAPVEVCAFGSSLIDDVRALGDHDNLVASLAFPSGLVASIDVNRRSAYGYDQRIEAFGDGGMLLAENQHINSVLRADPLGFHRSPAEYSFPTRYRAAYLGELECFLNCVRGQQSVPITDQAVRLNHLLATALEIAAREHRVVRLDEVTV
jgi:myo-inositol 2-dehydrogenase/D-chiro-inositol 1-dehydrogenase